MTNQFTDERVEAAARAMHESNKKFYPGMFQVGWEVLSKGDKEGYLDSARAALAAAAGAAPQAESSQARDLLALAKHLHRKYGRNQPTEWDMLSGALQKGWLIEAENTPMIAPVQPSSTVDEGKLTQAIYDELMTDDAVSEVWSNGKVMATARRLAKFAVVEAIGGESR